MSAPRPLWLFHFTRLEHLASIVRDGLCCDADAHEPGRLTTEIGEPSIKQFKRAYPAMFEDYERAAKAGRLMTGSMHVWGTGALTGPRYVINFPTKRHWRAPSRLADIEAGLADLVRVVQELGISSIAIPPLGCGNGGLNWEEVAPRIWEAFAPLGSVVDVRVYAPGQVPSAGEMVNRLKAPTMTPMRAALLGLLSAYHQRTWEWPSLVETQKLAYFLQQAGLPMRLVYVKGPYGPYADALRQTLRDLEGHYIVGFGDGSTPPLEAGRIKVTEPGLRSTTNALGADGQLEERFKRVLGLVGGFESPYGLELLSSVHWAAVQEGAATPAAAGDVVRGWTRRKADMFTQAHVDAAWSALDAGGWLRAPAPVG